MRIFWVWHSDSTITVDEMAHREQIQGKVDFMKICRIGLVGIQKTMDAARGGRRSKKQPNWGEGARRLRARWQRLGRADNLAVRGWTGHSMKNRNNSKSFGSNLVEEQIVLRILVSLEVVISNRQNMIANV